MGALRAEIRNDNCMYRAGSDADGQRFGITYVPHIVIADGVTGDQLYGYDSQTLLQLHENGSFVSTIAAKVRSYL